MFDVGFEIIYGYVRVFLLDCSDFIGLFVVAIKVVLMEKMTE